LPGLPENPARDPKREISREPPITCTALRLRITFGEVVSTVEQVGEMLPNG
jgi:hypothetical protein